MTDIVDRLRPEAATFVELKDAVTTMQEAADEIDRLRMDRDEYKQLYADALRDYVSKRDEVERLRKALRRVEGLLDSTDAALSIAIREAKEALGDD